MLFLDSWKCAGEVVVSDVGQMYKVIQKIINNALQLKHDLNAPFL